MARDRRRPCESSRQVRSLQRAADMPTSSRCLCLLLTALAVLLAGCLDTGVHPPTASDDEDIDCEQVRAQVRSRPARPVPRPGDANTWPALRPVESCTELAEQRREDALLTMESELDDSYQLAMYYRCWSGDSGDGSGGGGEPGLPSPADYSQTNVQVPGVDEPDFVKNDADYLYVTAGGALRIIDAWPAPETHVVTEVEIEGRPTQMFVADDRALVYSSLDPGSSSSWEDSWYDPRPCTYGYHCEFTGDGNPTKITVLDIADRAHPDVEREIWLSGSLVSARRIGTSVHTVVSDMMRDIPGVSYWPEGLESTSATTAEIKYAFDSLRARNRRIIATTPTEQLLPFMRDVVHGADGAREQSHPDACGNAFASSADDGTAITSVTSLDLASAGELSVTSIMSRPGAIYASTDALYMASSYQGGQLGDASDGWYDQPEISAVHKFAVAADPARAEYRGSGAVKGRVLNQFALDERDGDLRIATTTGWAPDPAARSTMTVLRESRGELAVVGEIDDIAPTEDIRSVRFDGDHGFIVTFKKTDPLFVFDLSEPEDPRMTGELHIPGFSTYMHLMDEDHLLTIGYDADDQGGFAWFTGVLLQIFDVSDMARPVLAHRELIGARGSSSDALTNHLAFNYYPTREALALPMTICEGSSGPGDYGTDMTFSGLMVYRVTPADGFSLTGQVAHPPGQDVGCYNWWTDARSQVERSVFMEDYVFSISHSRLKVNAMGALAEDLVDISLE